MVAPHGHTLWLITAESMGLVSFMFAMEMVVVSLCFTMKIPVWQRLPTVEMTVLC